MSTLKVNTLLAADANPLTPVAIPGLDKRFATAWVNFNGTGTVAIRSAYNVASITDNGVGDYTVNLSTPLANVNYAALVTASTGGVSLPMGAAADSVAARSISAIRLAFSCWITAPAAYDSPHCQLAIFGGQA